MSNADCTVEYREIPDFPYYRVGNDGSIWSCNAGKKTRQTKEWRAMTPAKSKSGHLVVALRKNGEYHRRYVHRIVAIAFIGPVPDGMEVCHNDGTTDNNIPGNLRFDTRKGNLADRYLHGTMNCGTRQGHAKLTDEKIKDVIIRRVNGEELSSIANLHGVTASTLYSVVHRETWRHVPIDPALLAALRLIYCRKT